MEGKYCIRMDTEADTAQNAPHQLAMALRDELKETLNGPQKQDIIAAMTNPTA